jgi:hypothetical protein
VKASEVIGFEYTSEESQPSSKSKLIRMKTLEDFQEKLNSAKSSMKVEFENIDDKL